MFFSDNFFETYTAVPLVLPFPPQNRCEGSSPFLIDGALFRKSLILNTAMGILRFDSTRKLWENIIPYCTMAFYPSQRPPYRREDCSHVIVAGYKTSSFQTLWRVRPDSNFIEELLDLKNRTISDVFPNIQVAAASSSSIDCGSVTVLVQTQSSYKIIEYTSRKEWKSMFDFPSRINIGGNTAFRKLTAADNSASSAETSAPLVLTGMNYGQSLGKELFFWGNTALFSPDGGISVYQMMELSRDTMVSTFSSANDDSYAMSLSDNSIWFGQVGKDILQVRPPRISDPGSKSYFKPMFDHDSVIVEVEVMTTGTDLQIRPQLLSLDSAIRRGELISGKSCPYSDHRVRWIL
ncbi:hypothetical protein BC829DRAFT_155376 [Chytridium lagenaria]|nr:hypothetical protein BC829DRAFT_155376 [Chytridium lagenaria]